MPLERTGSTRSEQTIEIPRSPSSASERTQPIEQQQEESKPEPTRPPYPARNAQTTTDQPSPFLVMRIIEEHQHDRPCVHALHPSAAIDGRESWINIGIVRVHPCYCWLLAVFVLMLVGAVIGVAVGVSLGRNSG